MAFIDGDTFLIKMVKKRPAIWQIPQNEKSAIAAWKEVAQRMSMPEEQLKMRWNRLLERYTKESERCKENQNALPRFKYYAEMDFLRQFRRNIQQQSLDSLDKEELEFVVGDEDIQKHIDACGDSSLFNLNANTNGTENIVVVEEKPELASTTSQTCGDLMSFEKRQRRPATADQAVQVTIESSQSSQKDERCEDKIFGEFVAATLKTMNESKKKRVKKDIIDALLA